MIKKTFKDSVAKRVKFVKYVKRGRFLPKSFKAYLRTKLTKLYQERGLFFLRRFFKTSTGMTLNKPKFEFIYSKENSIYKNSKYLLSIKITPNNIFCALKQVELNKTCFILSAGLLQLKMTKRRLKVTPKLIIDKFIEQATGIIPETSTFVIHVSGPKFLKRQVVSSLLESPLKKCTILINIINNKSFNGCRTKKKRRGKRRKGLKVFRK